MSKTRKERQHDRTRTEIKQIARRQMEAQGLNALSLRAIASEMGLTPPALYYYFSSRDDLVSSLAEDAFASLESTIMQALAVVQEHDHIEWVIAMFTSYREWAFSNHLGYKLVMGDEAKDPAAR
jgi:AcrR family transcriptional regulator